MASHQKEFTQLFPNPGWVEHDPIEIWNTQLETIQACLKTVSNPEENVLGIGITNQRETTVLWDRNTRTPLSNAIVWQDRRTAPLCSKLKSDPAISSMVQNKTGLVIDAYFSATKLKWLLDEIPGARAKAEKGELAFGTIDTWLIWNLTAGKQHITDPSNASRTMLCRIDDAVWDDELLALFDIPKAVLPEIRSSSEIYGTTDPTLFGAEIPIAGIAGDQQAALFGQACHSSGMAKNTYGTGCFLLMNTGTKRIQSQQSLLSTIAWEIDGEIEYALEGSVFIGGAVVQWLRDQLGIIDDASEIETLAGSVTDSDGVFFVPAFAGLGAPHWDSYARGTIVGMTRGTNKAHLARAALEAIAYQSKELLDEMEREGSIKLSELRVDGGASENDLLMQFQADILGVPVVRSSITETTALGAAYLAGLATGLWESKSDIAKNWSPGKTYQPNGRADLEQNLALWKKATRRAKNWLDSDES